MSGASGFKRISSKGGTCEGLAAASPIPVTEGSSLGCLVFSRQHECRGSWWSRIPPGLCFSSARAGNAEHLCGLTITPLPGSCCRICDTGAGQGQFCPCPISRGRAGAVLSLSHLQVHRGRAGAVLSLSHLQLHRGSPTQGQGRGSSVPVPSPVAQGEPHTGAGQGQFCPCPISSCTGGAPHRGRTGAVLSLSHLQLHRGSPTQGQGRGSSVPVPSPGAQGQGRGSSVPVPSPGAQGEPHTRCLCPSWHGQSQSRRFQSFKACWRSPTHWNRVWVTSVTLCVLCGWVLFQLGLIPTNRAFLVWEGDGVVGDPSFPGSSPLECQGVPSPLCAPDLRPCPLHGRSCSSSALFRILMVLSFSKP
ncbi:uncharacterized protein [Pithys albifrons albifrons]|uniref:uncharacterized protein n=1 Tax=Pithys albifrons albifrons TaxID=3385563 RepID=UPI003A5CF31F